MGVILRARIVLLLGIKRLIAERSWAAVTIIGLTLIVALTTAIPTYSDAVHYRVLVDELSSAEYGERPPFAFLFRYVEGGSAVARWAEIWSADQYITERAGDDLGLPQRSLVRYFATDTFYLFPQGESRAADADPLAWANFAFASDLENHIDVQRGSFPSAETSLRAESTGVLVSEVLAERLGLKVGDTLLAHTQPQVVPGRQAVQVPVYVAGVWRVSDPGDEFWFYSPKVLEDILFVSEGTFTDLVDSGEIEVGVALWYLLMDGSGVHAEHVDPLLARIDSVENQIENHLPGASLTVSPESALLDYRLATGTLVYSLQAASLPLLGILLVSIAMVARLAMERRRHENIVLHCRGASTFQVAGIAVLEQIIFAVIALAIGVPVGGLGALLIGRARGFFDFTMASGLRVGWTATAIWSGVAAVGLALAVQAFIIVGASRQTVTTYKHERVRMMQWPWWHRAWLDMLLLILAAYGYDALERQHVDPFQAPVFLLVPALVVLASTLLTLRTLPLIMSLVAGLASRARSVGFSLASRNLVRRPALYAAPLALFILTLSSSIFAASLARTLNARLYDRVYYDAGADLIVRELSESIEKEPYRPHVPPREGDGPGKAQRWVFRSVTEYLKVEGVEQAARAGRYSATARVGGRAHSGEFLGVDHWDFDSAAFWREEFSSVSLGFLMDALAVHPNGVLVPTDFLHDHGLAIGDTIEMKVLAYGGVCTFEMEVVGAFDAFPTWHGASEGEGSLFVGNLYYLFRWMGTQLPHDVWLRMESASDYEQIIEGIRSLGVSVLTWEASSFEIAEEQRKPERQGVFGTLSMGSLTAAVVTLIGLTLYAVSSVRRRSIELGVLRAVGMPAKQVATVLTWDLGMLLLVGLVVGTGLGVGVSQLFIPCLQPSDGLPAAWPPVAVRIAWPVIVGAWAACGLMLWASLDGFGALLTRAETLCEIGAREIA